jgi:hypothetical protein
VQHQQRGQVDLHASSEARSRAIESVPFAKK